MENSSNVEGEQLEKDDRIFFGKTQPPSNCLVVDNMAD